MNAIAHGATVRARIAGAPTPIRMNLRSRDGRVALVGKLPFLRTGEPLCIEAPGAPPDATARAAHIAGVSVEQSRDGIPNLVVELARRTTDVAPWLEEQRLRGVFRIEHLVLALGCTTLAMLAFLVGYAL